MRLRPLRAGDFDELYAAAADPAIWEQHPESDRYLPAVFRRFFEDAIASGGALAVIRKSDGAMVGSSRFHGFTGGREVEIGWTFLARDCWGGAYNRELKRLMVRHALRFVDQVVFLVGPGNLRSQRALEKIGAVRGGTRADDTGRASLLFLLKAEPGE